MFDRLFGLLAASGGIALVFSILGFFGRYWWVFELLSHFRVQYSVVLITCGLLLLFLASSRYFGLFLLLGAVINLFTLAPYLLPYAANDSNSEEHYRITTYNLNAGNGSYQDVLRFITENQPDLLVLTEFTSAWERNLKIIDNQLPYSEKVPLHSPFGIALYSKLPLESTEVLYLGSDNFPTIRARLSLNGKQISVWATHPVPPGSHGRNRFRNQQLAELGSALAQVTTPLIVAGDLNVSPWSYYFKKLAREARVRDSSLGRGIHPSWPSRNGLLRIPIDHVLVSKEFSVVNKQLGPALGSDHFPVTVDFVVD